MRYFSRISCVILLFITACNNAIQPNSANFTKAINAYLAKHGEACTVIGRAFPIDLSRPEQREQYGIAPKLAALEQAGLVHSLETTTALRGMLAPLRGSGPAQTVRRYELTELGMKYLQWISGAFGQTSGFCYGNKSVDTVVKWTQPVDEGASAQTEVSYTYRIIDAASWTRNPEVQQAFPDIRTTINGASKTTEVVGLQLTNRGWEVPAQ